MRPFFFGKSESPLFGIYHPPTVAAGAAARPGAVLLCNPFGQEAIRAHRIYAILAQKLSRLGMHVLRFDYASTGDSSGDVQDGDPERWIEDIVDAHDELMAAAEVNRIAWVGLRYGATLAVLAAEKITGRLSDLVLWDPVVNGSAYVGELLETHAVFMREDLTGWRAKPDTAESLGFPIGTKLRATMSAVDLGAPPPRRPRTRHLTVVASRQTAELERMMATVASWDVPSQLLSIASSSPWNSEEAMNASLIPMDVLEAIIARLQA